MHHPSFTIRILPAFAALTALLTGHRAFAAECGHIISLGNMPERNMVIPGHDLPVDLDEANTRWTADSDSSYCYSQPTVVGDRVVIGMADGNQGLTNEIEHASAARTHAHFDEKAPTHIPENMAWGDILWVLEMKDFGVHTHDAGSGTPLIIGNHVWVTTSHSQGLRPAHAQIKDPEEYAQALERGLNENPVPNIVVADKMNGRLLAWDRTKPLEVYHGQWGSLAAGDVDGETQVFWGDGYGFMHGFAIPEIPEGYTGEPLDLERLWWADGNPHHYRYADDGTELEYPHTHWKSPDQVRRKTGPSHFIGSPTFHNGKVYAGIGRDLIYNFKQRGLGLGGGAVTCFDPTGRGNVTDTHIVWQNTDVGRTHSTPSIKDGLLYIGSLDGHLHVLDAEDGSKIGNVDLHHAILERSQMVTDGKIYVGTHGGLMFTLSEGPEPEILWKGRFKSDLTTVTPVGDILLMGSHRELFAFRKNPQTTELASDN